MKKYTFKCILVNKGHVEEEFIVTKESVGLETVKQEIEDMLTEDYGWITKRIYQEDVKSDRYWDIMLVQVDIPTEKENK